MAGRLRRMPDQADVDLVVLEGVVRLMHAVADRPDLEELGLVEMLVDSGVDRASANRLIVFAPIAFGRLVLDELGVRGNEMYRRRLGDGRIVGPFPLLEVTEFRVAAEHRDHLRGARGFRELAAWSAEVDAVNNALHAAADIEGLVMEPLLASWEGD